MSYRFVCLTLIMATMSGCEQLNFSGSTSLSSNAVLASCQKALDGKDTKTAAKDCPFAEQWIEREQPDSLLHAEALEKLADLQAQTDANAAADNYQKALTLREKFADNAYSLEGLQLKLASNLSVLGKWAESEKVLRKIKPGTGMESVAGADILNRLGVAQMQQKRLPEADQSLRQALAIRKAKLSPSDPVLGETYGNLGFLYLSAGKDLESESFYRLAVSSLESAQPPSYSALYDNLSSLAALLQKEGKLQDAEAHLHKLLVAAEKGFGKESVQYSNGLNSLGMLGIAYRNFAAAEPLFNQSLAIREKILGANNIYTAESANNLAVALAGQGKRAQALPLMRHAAAVTNVAMGANNPLAQQRWNDLLQLEGGVANNPASSGKSKVQEPPAKPQAQQAPNAGKNYKR